MFFSLLQTLVCVLLVNTGLYALHLTGSTTSSGGNGGSNNGGGGGGSGSSLNVVSGPNSGSSTQFNKPSAAMNPFKSSTSNRLNEELADLAQLERERLMVMGLAKQTAEESIGYHGRPIITGRIKMHPAEDMDSEYSAWLSQQARNIMFGNVVKQPLNLEEDYDSGGGGGIGNGFDILRPHTTKYEYGRVVQPLERDREREFENPQNLNLDDFMELEQANEEDAFPDMDGYAYLEELADEEKKEEMQQQLQLQHQHQQHHYAQQQLHQSQMPQFPGLRQTQAQTHHMPYTSSSSALYQNHEPMDETKQAVQEFLEKEQKLQNLNHHQHQQQQQQQAQQQQQFNTKYRNNIRMQQKWLRKRNQQKEQLTRNIFGQKNAKALSQTLHQPASLHHFKGLSSNKLAMANSEATATTRINGKQQEIAQQQKLNLHEKDGNKNSSSSASASASAATSTAAVNNNELKLELLQHPNHKRSGLSPASLASSAGVSSPHSLASQLMLRTARGQRQYDVPQIECPTAMDGMERFACPTPDVQGRYRCIDDHVLCDGFIDCPEGEDEDRRSCMFYKTTKAHLDVLADALLRWARGR